MPSVNTIHKVTHFVNFGGMSLLRLALNPYLLNGREVAYPGWCPSGSQGSGLMELLFPFHCLHFESSESKRPRLAPSVSGHNGWVFIKVPFINASLDYPQPPRSEKPFACGNRGLHLDCHMSNARVQVRMPRDVLRVSALGILPQRSPFKA